MKKQTTTLLAAAALLQAGAAWGYDISDRFQINTLIEVEAFDTDDAEGDFSGVDGQDIELATVEVGVEAQPTDRLSGHVLFLYEEGAGDEVVVDEATVSFALNDTLGLTAGKEYVPFGRFETLVITDPLTLELGETNETVAQLDFGGPGWGGAVYAYSGDTTDAAGDAREGLGIGVDFEQDTWAIGGSLISNLGDSDLLQEVDGGGGAGVLSDDVPGLGLHALGSFGAVTLIAEHVRALDDFVAGDLGGAVAGDSQPTATNLEAGFEIGGGWAIAGAYRMTDEAQFAGLPETMIAAAVSYQITDQVGIALEVNSKEDYDLSDGGTGDDSRTVLAQLAVEF